MKKSAVVRDAVIALFLGIIPGWGHIYLRRPLRGLLIFILFFALADCVLLMALEVRIDLPKSLARPLAALAAAVYVFSVVDVIRWALWSRSKSAQSKRQNHFRKVIAHFLKNELGQAEESAEAMLRIDPHDGTALVYLGLIHGARGRKKKAIATLKRALRWRRDDTSVEDIERELRRLSEDTHS